MENVIKSIQQLNFDEILDKKSITKKSERDKYIMLVRSFVSIGWPKRDKLSPEILPFFEKRGLLSIEEGILLVGDRIIITKKLRELVLNTLHQGHPGIVEMKSLSRRYVWWPGLNKDRESLVKACACSQENRQKPSENSIYQWIIPEKPRYRIHVDYTGPIEGKMWLVIVDAKIKWVEVIPMKVTETRTLIQNLNSLFSHFGLPKQLVSDNGSIYF
ncbi:Pro-Pol polyprotein [Thelohanellus kitauei]|uniref:Pro-Pol polyprotein n=1 Tax=Thelohanellus kitauei TaxID=669202 RepID=A0A0C2IN53_THEKT|nr:Pro-Pol polyprotein [Thelohanellus kitauei]